MFGLLDVCCLVMWSQAFDKHIITYMYGIRRRHKVDSNHLSYSEAVECTK